MKRGEVLSATARAERARATTKAAIAREVLYASILARIWPAYLVEQNDSAFPYLLCVESPAGVLRWPLDPEERDLFDFVPIQEWQGERRVDRTAVLLALATDGGWAIDGKYPR